MLLCSRQSCCACIGCTLKEFAEAKRTQTIESVYQVISLIDKFSHWVALLKLIQIWPPDCLACIGCKFGHQVALEMAGG